jgi:hypothetical protein
MYKLRKQTDWPATYYPGAADSLREDLEETFTSNRLELPPARRRCLGTTNIIAPHAGVSLITNRVIRCRDGQMVLRGVAAINWKMKLSLTPNKKQPNLINL